METNNKEMKDKDVASNKQKRPLPEEDKSVVGFVHNTSPVKRSKTNMNYFDSQIQTGSTQFQRVVCFHQRHHTFFKEAEEKKSPIKLAKIHTTPNWYDNTKEDIKVNKDTTLENTKKALSFKYKTPKLQQPVTTTVTDFVYKIPSTEKNKINITAFVNQVVEEQSEVQLSYKTEPTKKKVFAIADDKTSVRLTAWADSIDIIEINHTYKFTNLSVSNFNIKHLQTTTSTIITETDEMENPCLDLPELEDLTKLTSAKCESVQCSIIVSCNSCKAIVNTVDLLQNTYRCKCCNMRQLSASVLKQVRVKLNLSDHGVKYRISAHNPVLSDFLKAQEVSLDTADEVEEFFLSAKPFAVTINSNYIATSFAME
ncbi:uncharacterized protein LOC135495838 isoform X2 [Lineus longissimus]